MTTSSIAENGTALADGRPTPEAVMRWWRIGLLVVAVLSVGLAVLAAVLNQPYTAPEATGPATNAQQRILIESTARDDFLAVMHAIAAIHGLAVTEVSDVQDFQPFLPVSTRFTATRTLPVDARLKGWERQVLLLNKKIFHLRHEFHDRVKQSYVWLQVFQWFSILISAATTLIVALNTHGLSGGAPLPSGAGSVPVAWPQRWRWALGMSALLLSTLTTVIGSVGSFYGPQQDYASNSAKLAGLTALHAEIAFTVSSLDSVTGVIEKSRLDDWMRRFTDIGVHGSNSGRKQGDSDTVTAAMHGAE